MTVTDGVFSEVCRYEQSWIYSQPTLSYIPKSFVMLSKVEDELLSSANLKQEKPTSCGTETAAVFDKFSRHANPLNVLVHLQLLLFHNAYQFKVLAVI